MKFIFRAWKFQLQRRVEVVKDLFDFKAENISASRGKAAELICAALLSLTFITEYWIIWGDLQAKLWILPQPGELWSLMRLWFASFKLLCFYFQPFSLLLHTKTLSGWFDDELGASEFDSFNFAISWYFPVCYYSAGGSNCPHPSPKPSKSDRIDKLLEITHNSLFFQGRAD